MLLVIDVGNTNIVLGIFKDSDLWGQWRIFTNKSMTSDEIGLLMAQLLANRGVHKEEISDIIISSVVPSMDDSLHRSCRVYFSLDPYFVRPGEEEYISVAYEKPAELGADRVVNAVAAFHLYGAPAIIIDFGTATTFCVLSREGKYLGGCIFPGLQTSASALFKAAEKLVPVKIEQPQKVIGRTTTNAIQSGFFWGFSAMVEGLVARIAGELQDTPLVIATGGNAHLFQAGCPAINIFDEHLTLKGLNLIYKNKNKGKGEGSLH
ncbi:MAG: type III pantothenate kinase [bacterium]